MTNFYPGVVRAEEQTPLLLITEVQTAGVDSTSDEFVEIYNPLSEPVVLSGWKLIYSSSSDSSPKVLMEFEGQLAANSFLLVASASYVAPANVTVDVLSSYSGLAAGGGHLRLFNADDMEIDKLGWGTAVAPDTSAAPSPAAGVSLQRVTSQDGLYIDTNNNAEDFNATETPDPQGGGLQELPEEVNEDLPSCDGVVVSEILPNPASSDSGKEFIEIHNPTEDVIELKGCTLSVTGSSKVYEFDSDLSLEAGQYLAFYDSETGLTLPNAAGGEVVLASATTEYPYNYPEDMKDDYSWALLGTEWLATDNVTPGAANEAPTPSEEDEEEASVLAPCPVGKYRNPLTNRCKTIAITDAVLEPCKPGQVRNPETNRCRSTVSSSTLTPCKPGQERNPETNRCRSVLSDSKELKPCGEGEERNPETNRCRKVTASLASASIDGKRGEGQQAVNYGVLGLVGSSAIGYGLYEYRNDFRSKFLKFKSRFFPDKSGE